MKRKPFSVASVQTNCTEFDFFGRRDQKNFFFVFGDLPRAVSFSQRQTDVALDGFTKFVHGNAETNFDQHSLEVFLNRDDIFFLNRIRRPLFTETGNITFESKISSREKQRERHPDEKG